MIAIAVLLATGIAEAMFPAGPAAELSVRIAAGCADKGWQIVSQSDNQVLCEHDPDPMVALEHIGTRGPVLKKRGFSRFIVLPTAEGIRVQISGYTAWQTPLGQERQFPNTFTVDDEKLLASIGGTVTKGQTVAASK